MFLRAGACTAALLLVMAAARAQQPVRPASDGESQRLTTRIAALQREAERLAGETRTLVNALRGLEVERDLRLAEAAQAAEAVTAARLAVQQTTDRLQSLEAAREAQLPDLEAQLVDLYKRGRSRYAQLIAGAKNARELARATRAVGALAGTHQRRIAEHRRTLDALRAERLAFELALRQVEEREAAARKAHEAAENAVRARERLVAQLDARRDLNAQYVGELQVAYDRIRQQLTAAPARADTVFIPIQPFRGALDWPVRGQVTGRFGQTSGRLGGTAVRNGIDITAAEGTRVRAVHRGTVALAEGYAGFGTLVILDHGGGTYSLYGYLGSTTVERGALVDTGAELGTVGASPAGPPALYFEMRIDGRSVDPVEWLRPNSPS